MTPAHLEPGGFMSDPAIAGSDMILPDLGLEATRQYLAVNGWDVAASQPRQLLYRPGRSVVVRRAVVASRGGSERRFSVTTEARRSPAPLHEGVAGTDQITEPIVRHSESTRSWAFPFDPWLPGLHDAINVDGVRRIAETVMGYECTVQANVLRYRPGRRAVLRYVVRRRGRSGASPTVLYVKSLRPKSIDIATRAAKVLTGLEDRYAVPATASPPNVLVYHELPGRPLRTILLKDGYADLPPRTVYGDVMRELAALPEPGEGRLSSASARFRSARKLLSTVAPHLSPRLERLAARIDVELSDSPVRDVVVHGDLYEAQILVGEAGRAAILDLDDLGVGDPGLDAANVSAHLVALAESHPQRARIIELHRSMVRADLLAAAGIDEPALRAREAIAMVQLATGPLRVLADDWLDRTERRLTLAEAMLAT